MTLLMRSFKLTMENKISCVLSLMVMCLFLGLGQVVYAMDDDNLSSHAVSSTLPQVEDDGLDTEELESEEIVDMRTSIINDVKAAMPQYQKGDIGIMRWVNGMCKEYKITQEELGVESNPWPQDPKKVSKLPPEEMFAAIQKVMPDIRYAIPKETREGVLKFELSKITDSKEKAAKTEFLKSQLALHVCEFTNSQEEAHNKTFPSLLNESACLARQLMTLEVKKSRLIESTSEIDIPDQNKVISEIEIPAQNDELSDPKKRKLETSSATDNVAKKMKEDFEIFEIDFQKEMLEESRKEIISQQKPLVRKITRNFSVGNFKN
jgi:hypothetical protein